MEDPILNSLNKLDLFPSCDISHLNDFHEFRISLYIRGIEESIVKLAKNKILRGPIHSYVGEEAVATGILLQALDKDSMTSTHRGHGHYIAKGGNITKLIDELHGKKSGCNGGHGGSMHVADLSINHFGANGIVGGGVPIACGLALSHKLDKKENIVFCFFGDGASNQGVVLESFNIAAFMSLPIIFICENNQYAQSTKLSDVSKTSVSEKALGFGIESCEVNGLNISEVKAIASQIIHRVRCNKKPFLIQANTYRFHRHFVSERPKDIDYLDLELHKQSLSRDPLKQYCLENNLEVKTLENHLEEIQKVVLIYSDSLNKK